MTAALSLMVTITVIFIMIGILTFYGSITQMSHVFIPSKNTGNETSLLSSLPSTARHQCTSYANQPVRLQQ